MKKAVLVAAVLALVVSAFAASDVRNTKHNLSNWGGKTYRSTNYNEICVFCHTPHAASGWPLWNRQAITATFTAYTSVAFDPQNYGGTGQPDQTSKLCFTCHLNANTWSSGSTLFNPSNLVNNVQPSFNHNNFTGTAAIGLDLRNDHPIGFNYDQAQAATSKYDLKPAASVATLMFDTAANIFSANQMTCSSCHDVHGKISGTSVIPVLLRRSNASSLLCYACHSK